MGITGSGVRVFVGVGNGIGVPRAQGAMGTLREPCRGGSNGNQRKNGNGPKPSKIIKRQPKPPSQIMKDNQNHQN